MLKQRWWCLWWRVGAGLHVGGVVGVSMSEEWCLCLSRRGGGSLDVGGVVVVTVLEVSSGGVYGEGVAVVSMEEGLWWW